MFNKGHVNQQAQAYARSIHQQIPGVVCPAEKVNFEMLERLHQYTKSKSKYRCPYPCRINGKMFPATDLQQKVEVHGEYQVNQVTGYKWTEGAGVSGAGKKVQGRCNEGNSDYE